MRIFKTLIGSLVVAMGIIIFLETNQGADPLSVLYQGVINQTGYFLGKDHTFGTISATGGFLILLIAFGIDRKKIGIGSLINAVSVGIFINILYSVNADRWVPSLMVLNLFMGPIILGIGLAIYLSADLGAGPIEAIMLIIVERTELGLKYVRIALDALFVGVGLLLGAFFGWGIVTGVLLIGPTIEYALKFQKKMKAWRAS